MSENDGGGGGGSLSDEQRCKRSDGKKWRCRRVVMEGRTLCEAHFLQGRHRQHKEPVPDDLKLERTKRSRRNQQQIEENPNGNLEIRANGDVGSSNLTQKRGKKKSLVDQENPGENLEIGANGYVDSSNLTQKRGKRKNLVDGENPSENLDIRANGDLGSSNLPQKRGKRKNLIDEENPSENLEEIRANGKRGKRIHKEDDDALKKMKLKKGDLIRGYLNREIEKKKKGKQPQKGDIVKELKYGRLEISQSSPSTTTPIATSVNNGGGLLNVKVGIPASNSIPTRFFRSKNVDRLPIATMQILPSIKANVKASAKKCHWCRMGSYRVLVKCLTCKKQFFCEDCIHERHLDKAEIKKQCPVCHGNCSCRVCIRERSKEVKTKDLVVYNGDEKFDKRQQLLYMLYLLLPLLEQINEEKIIELEIEAKIQGKEDSEVEIPCATSSQKRECCSFCKACTVDVYRSCGNCFYVLCLSCCREFRDGDLHGGLRNSKYTKNDKRKSSLCAILRDWNADEDGSIKCPPKNLGGCGDGVLGLFCHSPVNWSKDLETSAKEIVSASKIAECFEADSSGCALCDEPGHREGKNVDEILVTDKRLYFPILEDLGDGNLRHFVKHWVKGQPLIVRDVIKSESELSWDPVFMFCTYLERSAKSRKDKEVKLKSCSDWCEVQMGRQQIFMGGKTHANVWHEKLKFKVWLSSRFFQEHFPSHYAAVMHALPVQEYINPLTGILNLAANVPPESQSLDLGPFVYISYGSGEDLMRADFLTKLCYHAYDMVNILVHATELPISEKKLNKVKILLSKYSSQDQNELLEKNETNQPCGRSSFSSEVTQQSEELEDNTKGELTQILNGKNPCAFSDDSSLSESDDEDLCQDESGSSSCNKGKPVDTCGAQWDVFRREDVPKLVEYLRKYSNELNQSYSSSKKVVHPILDENFYLNALHKKYLKDEFDVEPWTFEQCIGEAVIIPAGCPYQVKKVKSCVNVVFEFISPESASIGIKLSDETRQLPVNHKAKGKMLGVKKMTIHSVSAAVEEIRTISQAEINEKVGE